MDEGDEVVDAGLLLGVCGGEGLVGPGGVEVGEDFAGVNEGARRRSGLGRGRCRWG
jgi:hypothetical protein